MASKGEAAPEDPVLVQLRHTHEDMLALVNDGPFRTWVSVDEESPGILQELVRTERLLYELRAGRAVWIGQQADQEALAAQEETLQLFEEPESGTPF